MARVFQLDRALVVKIEGRVSEVRERSTATGAQLGRPVDFVADAAGVSRSTVQRWIRDARRAERRRDLEPRSELLRDFLASFDALCRASIAPIELSLIRIASDPKHARCVDAAKWLAPRLDPIGETQHSEHEPAEREPSPADIPQAVYEALTVAERARLAELDQTIDALNDEAEALMVTAAARVGVNRAMVVDALRAC